MYIYIYIIYIYIYNIHTNTHTHTHIYIYIYTYRHTHIYMKHKKSLTCISSSVPSAMKSFMALSNPVIKSSYKFKAVLLLSVSRIACV